MKFKYSAVDASGKKVEDTIEAQSMGDILRTLGSRGLKPLAVSPVKARSIKQKRIFGGKITSKEKIFLVRYLSLMLQVGSDLLAAINILIENFENPAMKAFLQEVRASLEKGEPFHKTFSRHPKYFSATFVNLVKAGESSGTLDRVFQDLSLDLERQETLRQNIRSALTYPVILFVMSILILLFLTTFALPRIARVFDGGGINPPAFSRIVFAVGLFLGNYAILIFGTFFVLIIATVIFLRSVKGKRFIVRLLTRLPVIKTVIQKLSIQQFTVTLSLLLKSGLPFVDSLEITSNVVSHEKLRSAIQAVSREGLAKGLTVGEAFQRQTEFPPVVSNLIAISEKAGHLPDILETLSHFYEEEVNHAVKRMVVFLEPLMLVLIGGVVAIIALSIIVPIYQLVGQFRQ